MTIPAMAPPESDPTVDSLKKSTQHIREMKFELLEIGIGI